MSKKSADSKNTDQKNKSAGEETAAADDAANKPDDAAGEASKPPAKTEKTYSKADIDKAVKDGIEAAQKKWKEEQDLSDLERANNELKALKEANRLRDAKDEVTAALTKEGAKSPDLLFAASQDKLQFDDSGKITNLTDLVKGLKDAYADQFGVDTPEGTIDGGAGTSGGGAKLTKETLAKMSAVEIAKLDWTEVSKVLAEG